MNARLKEKMHWNFVGVTGAAGALCLSYAVANTYLGHEAGQPLWMRRDVFCCYLLCVPLFLAACLGFERRYRMLFCIVAFAASQLVAQGFARLCIRVLGVLEPPLEPLFGQFPLLVFLSMVFTPALFVATLYVGWKFYQRSLDFHDARFPTTNRGRPSPAQAGVAL